MSNMRFFPACAAVVVIEMAEIGVTGNVFSGAACKGCNSGAQQHTKQIKHLIEAGLLHDAQELLLVDFAVAITAYTNPSCQQSLDSPPKGSNKAETIESHTAIHLPIRLLDHLSQFLVGHVLTQLLGNALQVAQTDLAGLVVVK